MVFRVEKTTNYTVMSNYHLREKNMTLKAKGLLSWMLSNDDNWDYSIAGIVTNCKENETAIKTALKELQEFGYLEVVKKSPDKNINTIHYEYIIHERPVNSQGIENLCVDNLSIENQAQRNTNTRNTNIKEVLDKSKTKNRELFDVTSKKVTSNRNQYQKCMDLILAFTDDEILIDYLKSCYKLFSENSKESGTPFYTNTFKGKLNKLKSLSEDNYEQRKIVLQTLDNGWNGFYELKSNKKTKNVARDIEQLDESYTMKQGDKQELRRAIENGTAEQF